MAVWLQRVELYGDQMKEVSIVMASCMEGYNAVQFCFSSENTYINSGKLTVCTYGYSI
jgi:hypothetical protein